MDMQVQAPNLVALWEAHCRYEFETRDVDATMATMTAEPYVNHVPTLTGGVGHDQLKRFYKHHFIGGNPPDTELVPVSRTVGEDQIVDEMLFRFTHTSEIDWMLPGTVAVADPRFNDVKSIKDVSNHTLLEIQHFFGDLQVLEHREVSIGGWEDVAQTQDRLRAIVG